MRQAESWYEVTFLGLRRKPWTTTTTAKSKAHALAVVRSDYVVTAFLDCRRLFHGHLTRFQAAVYEFLGHPRQKGAVQKLREAFKKEIK